MQFSRKKKDFVTAVNNTQKINPPAYLSVDVINYDNKQILHVYVPESSNVHRCGGRIFDRNEDADIDITNNTKLVFDMYIRKQASYSENKVFPYADFGELRIDLIEKSRKMASAWNRNHPWLTMDDMQLLKSAQLYKTNPETGKSGLTLAGILLFGNDNLILAALPHHRTDLILRKVNIDRYDDRDLVRTNLIESYDRIIAFIQKHLSDPFFLEGINRISLRDSIFREVASNILIHREYSNAFPAKLIIERNRVYTENANRANGFGPIDPEHFVPYPKNPLIGAFFREIHRADELGSGMRNIMKYGKTYSGSTPKMIENDIFRFFINLPVSEVYSQVSQRFPGQVRETSGVYYGRAEVATEVNTEVATEVNTEVINMLKVLKGNMSRKEIMAQMNLVNEKHFREYYQQRCVKLGLIEMTIPDKPRSSRQKYRITEKGKALLRKM